MYIQKDSNKYYHYYYLLFTNESVLAVSCNYIRSVSFLNLSSYISTKLGLYNAMNWRELCYVANNVQSERNSAYQRTKAYNSDKICLSLDVSIPTSRW